MELLCKLATYNMHGYRQGTQYLTELCNCYDLILIQEHWLTIADVSSLIVNDDFVLYASSAMEKAVSSGVLRGRPFGGVGILMRKSLASRTKLLCKSDRYVIVCLDKTILCSIYMPCKSVNNFEDVYADTLSNVINIVNDTAHDAVIVGGDFNTAFNCGSVLSFLVRDFCDALAVTSTDHMLPPDESYTFRNTMGGTSLIDHFIVSNHIVSSVKSINIIDSGLNMSDHLPVCMHILLRSSNSCVSNDSATDVADSFPVPDSLRERLRWDKADGSLYYNTVYQQLCRVNVPVSIRQPTCMDPVQSKADIEALYLAIISALRHASDSCVPKKKCNFFKHWWDDEFNEAKKRSITSHRLWVENGKPRAGPVYLDMVKCRNDYKLMIKSKERDGKNHFSNELSDALQCKNTSSFWKSWKSKFRNNKKTQVVGGACDPGIIANKFAAFFKSVCTSNSQEKHAAFRNEFYAQFDTYSGHTHVPILTVNDVDNCIRKLKLGKAAGYDGITVEHLLYSHPILVVLTTFLFNACTQHGYVPNDFAFGLLIPLLKSNDLDSTNIENYRGITISCVFSKLFELCLLKSLDGYLQSSELQFGFKPNVGSRDAILTARTVVNYFTARGSTAVVSALDLSKAFDKVEHFGLFCKLLERHVPRCFVELIVCWYTKCIVSVRWGNCLSAPFAVLAGVRQGGILSPALFSLYIDQIVHKLQSAGYGCSICNIFLGCILYADDILLISNSVVSMQKMLDICTAEAADLDLCFNANKSVAMRVGSRFKVNCTALALSGNTIKYVDCIEYLGVFVKSGKCFTCTYDHIKLKFYRAFNSLYSKSKAVSSELISVYLLKAFCLPLITYSIEASAPSNKNLRMLDNLVGNAVRKIFNVSEDQTVQVVRSMVGLSSVSYLCHMYTCKFLLKFAAKPLIFSKLIFELSLDSFKPVLARYNKRDDTSMVEQLKSAMHAIAERL